MSEQLLSVGVDVGTTSTQLVFSRLTVENRASGFAVPELEIARREILYKSPVYFTPLSSGQLVDGEGIQKIVDIEYRNAGVSRQEVDTGAIIITGETSRKENARRVLEALSEYAGAFVVATAGPDLESILAAKGAGADLFSAETGKTVLHMDIGGGTSNLALIRNGEILETGCLNVGGRLVKLDETGVITYVSPVLQGITTLKAGEKPEPADLEALAELLTSVLEMAAGLRPPTQLLEQLTTAETGRAWKLPLPPEVLSFSGGVAECIGQEHPALEFGDIGPLLGRAISASALCRGEYRLGSETIRATVIGAGCHSTQLSGSTVFYQNIRFPLKNVPVVDLERFSPSAHPDGPVILAAKGIRSPSYSQVLELAQKVISRVQAPVLLCLEQDMAKALGQALALRLPSGTPLLCIDRVKVGQGSYLDIGAPVGTALPVVVKTLVLGR